MEKKDCDTCQFENTIYEEPCRGCISSGKSRSNWQPRELEQPTNPLKTQIGGSHYKNFAIQPAEFITKNKLTWLEDAWLREYVEERATG